MPVAYSEMHGSPIEQHDQVTGERTATMSVKCTWAERYTLLSEFLTGTFEYPHESGSKMYARSATCRPFPAKEQGDGSASICEYEDAVVDVQFRKQKIDDPFQPSSGMFSGEKISEVLEPHVEFLTLDYRKFRWGAADGAKLTEAEAPGMQLKSWDWVVTLYDQAVVPAALLILMGCVNLNGITSGGFGLLYPAETLLFNPPTIERAGDLFNLSYRFSYRPNGWNKFWRAETQTWSNIYVAGGAIYRSYPTSDFSGL